MIRTGLKTINHMSVKIKKGESIVNYQNVVHVVHVFNFMTYTYTTHQKIKLKI